jgi:hypothetical protein
MAKSKKRHHSNGNAQYSKANNWDIMWEERMKKRNPPEKITIEEGATNTPLQSE